ncbi:MAG: GGDEF domain-containing protein [Betaproteobacteria bacterium]
MSRKIQREGANKLIDYGNATLIVTDQDTLISELNKASNSEACLIVVRGQQQGKRYELSAQSMRMGRDSTSEIVINDPKVSRRQAIIEKNSGTVMLIDGGSTNGTYLNDRKLESGTSVVLNKEDMIKAGDTVLKYLPRGALEIRYIGMLEAKAYTDALTQVYNKGYLLEALDAEFKRAKGLETAFSVLFLDLDHFKQVNDTYGHDAGDRVLIEISRILRNAVAISQGILGRFGGEEFVALLPGQSASAANDLAEFIRNTVEQHSFPLEDQSIKMTSSIGVATMTNDTIEAADLLKLADKAVYQAKNTGRNKVCSASED